MLKCYLVTENNSTQTNVELEKPAGGVKNTLEGGGDDVGAIAPAWQYNTCDTTG